MSRNRRERGEGQFGCLVGLVLLLLAGLIAYKLIPIKVKAADLRETVVNESKSAGRHSDRAIVGNIMFKAKQLEFPLKEEDIHVSRSASYVTIDVTYTVPVQFPGYTYNWDFRNHYENPIF